jgi:hypothetical protein
MLGMDKEALRHRGAWLLTVAFEVGATLMAIQAAWIVVALLGLAGVIILAAGYWPQVEAAIAKASVRDSKSLPGPITYLDPGPDGSLIPHLSDEQKRLIRIARRAMIGVVVIVAVSTVLYVATRLWSANPVAGGQHEQHERQFVAFGPQYLIDMIRGRSSEESEKLTDLYRGRWMKVHGRVAILPAPEELSVEKTPPTEVMIDYMTSAGLHETSVFCYIYGSDGETAMTLQKDESLSVIGKINGVNSIGVELRPCQLVSFNQ